MEQDRDDPGIPEPQIGPSQFAPRLAGHGGGDVILESIEELSQDSLDESQETIGEMSQHSSGRSSRAASDRGGSGRSSRVQYQPVVQDETGSAAGSTTGSTTGSATGSDVNIPTPSAGGQISLSVVGADNPFELTENYLPPLVSAGGVIETQDVIDDVIENMMEDLKEQLKNQLRIEWEKDRKNIEAEHLRRLKELNEHHQNEQFQIYEKNVQLHERITNLEKCLKEKDVNIKKLQTIILEEGEVHVKSRAVHQWRLNCHEKRVEKRIMKLLEETRKRRLMETYFKKWLNICRSKFKAKVEKVCKDRATEICLKLKDELTSEINRLKQEVANRDKVIADLEEKHSRYEEGLSKALMRGVCALNMEAMSVLNNPDFNAVNGVDDNIENMFRVGSAGDRISSASSGTNRTKQPTPIAPQNSVSNINLPPSGAPRYPVAKPASNIFIDTVNSLEDLNSKKKKIKVRNSSEMSGRFGDRNETLSRSVRIERHDGQRTIKTDQSISGRPEAKKPWVPASVNILNCENQRSRRNKQTFAAVKHVD